MTPEDWQAGHTLLAARVAAIAAAVRWTAEAPHPALDAGGGSRIVTTGVGSSEAHARLLEHLLAESAGLDARFVPLSAVAVPAAAARSQELIVFSQGLSPNIRLALEARARWARVVLVTAVSGRGSGERDELVRTLSAEGVPIVPFAGENEYGTLVRVVGPMAGYVAAWRVAEALAADRLPPLEPDRILAAIERAPAAVASLEPDDLGRGLAFLASGTYAALTANLRYKVLEGMLLPAPPVWDLLHVAHGPLQQAFAGEATFLALTRAGAPLEDELCARLEAALDPARHRLVRVPATLRGPLAILEHEAAVNALMLRWIEARGVDQVRWPGRGREAPLYALGTRRRLAELTWPEVEAAIAAGRRTAVLPLGALEQHGPHLPLATDTWIGDALAEGVCARLEDTLQLPTVALGCSVEHMAFPGTVDLRAETLTAVLADTIRSLAHHGIARVFVFSAHGGNVSPLRDALPALRAAVAPVEVVAQTDLDDVTARLHRVAAAHGIAPGAAGHHAGEVETSILLAIRPGAVRMDMLAAGLVADVPDPQALFYPSLRPHAPDGTVGDPRPADAARGERYLAAWTDALVETYRSNASAAKGTKKA
jgi:creatinine amidohydrolase